MSSDEVCQYLGITKNNLYQISYRNQISWVEKRGKQAFYNREQVEAYKAKRDAR